MKARFIGTVDFFHIDCRESVSSIRMYMWLTKMFGDTEYIVRGASPGRPSGTWVIERGGYEYLTFRVGDVIFVTDAGWWGKARELHFFTDWQPVGDDGGDLDISSYIKE